MVSRHGPLEKKALVIFLLSSDPPSYVCDTRDPHHLHPLHQKGIRALTATGNITGCTRVQGTAARDSLQRSLMKFEIFLKKRNFLL